MKRRWTSITVRRLLAYLQSANVIMTTEDKPKTHFYTKQTLSVKYHCLCKDGGADGLKELERNTGVEMENRRRPSTQESDRLSIDSYSLFSIRLSYISTLTFVFVLLFFLFVTNRCYLLQSRRLWSKNFKKSGQGPFISSNAQYIW